MTVHEKYVVCVYGLEEMEGIFDTVDRGGLEPEVVGKIEVLVDWSE